MRGKDHIHGYINGQVISFEADVTDFIRNKTQTKFGRCLRSAQKKQIFSF